MMRQGGGNKTCCLANESQVYDLVRCLAEGSASARTTDLMVVARLCAGYMRQDIVEYEYSLRDLMAGNLHGMA